MTSFHILFFHFFKISEVQQMSIESCISIVLYCFYQKTGAIFMEKKDILLLLALLLVGGLLWFFLRPQKVDPQSTVRITVDGSVYGEYALDSYAEVNINDTNVCVIDHGTAYMKSANCPDQICVKTKAIKTSASSIVCLPNKVVVEIVTPKDAEVSDVPDAVVQ